MPTAIGCHARYQPARQEQLGVRRLAQGHFDTARVGSNRQPSDCQTTALPPEPHRFRGWFPADGLLTGGGFGAVVPVPEVLRVLHHGDAGHPDDNGVRAGVQGARADDGVIDVVQRAG